MSPSKPAHSSNLPRRRIPLPFDTPESSSNNRVRRIIQDGELHTVCQEAACPNLHHCWNRGTATFLILGNRCTRNCRFCDIQPGKPEPVNPDEPRSTALAVQKMRLKHAVITSVTRDDLPDGGAGQFQKTIELVRKHNPGTTVEFLVPDFKGNPRAIDLIIQSQPDVLNHNIETVGSLYPAIRPGATLERSYSLLRRCKEGGLRTKSGIMVGLGETIEEVQEVLSDLRANGVDMVTIGQYLPPSQNHAPVVEYVEQCVFDSLGEYAKALGFSHVESGSLVRSSYHAEEGLD